MLPCDTAPGFQSILVKIRNPKTRGRSAKHQSARIDPSDLVRLISAVYKDFDAEQACGLIPPRHFERDLQL